MAQAENIDDRAGAKADKDRQAAGSDADRRRQEQMGYSDRLRQEQMAAKDRERQGVGGEEGSSSAEATADKGESGSFRERWRAAKRAMDLKQKAKDKLKEKVTAPARAATSKLLQQAWINLIDSFGLTLIYINIHVFLRMVFGEKLFCKLGDEWIPKQIAGAGGEAGKMAGKSIGLVEVMGLLLLDLIVFFAVIGIIALLVWLSDNIVFKILYYIGSKAYGVWEFVSGS